MRMTRSVKTHRTMTPSLSRLTRCIYCTIIDLGGVTFRAKGDPSQDVDTQSESIVYVTLERGHLWTRIHSLMDFGRCQILKSKHIVSTECYVTL